MLILTPGIYPDRHSGLPKLVYYLSREIQKRGHEIVVLTRRYESSHPEEESIDGMRYFRVPIPKRGDRAHLLWPFITSIRSRREQKRLRHIFPDINIVWVHNPWWLLGTNPKKLWPSAKIIYDFHSDFYSELTHNHPRNPAARLAGYLFDRAAVRAIRRSDLVAVHSEYTRGRCLAIAGTEIRDRIRIVPGGSDKNLFHPLSGLEQKATLRRELDLPNNRTLFVTARGLKPRTGVDKLLRAAALLKDGGVPFYLTIIGRGVMEQEIRRLMKDLNLEDSVRLISGLSEMELARNYQAADAFVLPTQGAEGFGLATTEALLTGLVVLGTNNGATPEILSHYCSDWIVPGSDPESLSQKMGDFCQHRQAYEMPVSEIRAITLNNYSWPVAADRFLEAVREIGV